MLGMLLKRHINSFGLTRGTIPNGSFLSGAHSKKILNERYIQFMEGETLHNTRERRKTFVNFFLLAYGNRLARQFALLEKKKL